MISWGLFQAAACGARLLVNQFEGFSEVFDDPAIQVVDLDDQNAINRAVFSCLDTPRLESSGSSLRGGLDLKTSIQSWIDLVRAVHRLPQQV